jgi:hypothetical protein
MGGSPVRMNGASLATGHGRQGSLDQAARDGIRRLLDPRISAVCGRISTIHWKIVVARFFGRYGFGVKVLSIGGPVTSARKTRAATGTARLAVVVVPFLLAVAVATADTAHASPYVQAISREAVPEVSAPRVPCTSNDDECALCESGSTDLVEPPLSPALDIAQDSASPAADPVAVRALGCVDSVNQARAPPERR